MRKKMEREKEITCILVDDEENALYRMSRLLKYFDNIKIVSEETNAEKAIKKIVEFYPEIVFLDVEMGGKNGFDIVREVRKKNIFPTFIFVTGYNQYAIKAIKNAAFDYLIKPVDIDELSETIKRFVEKETVRFYRELPTKLKKEYRLTDREIEITQLIIEGKTSKEIAEKLFISKLTVDTHRKNILRKTGAKNFEELIRKI